jgi:hypothetical protein
MVDRTIGLLGVLIIGVVLQTTCLKHCGPLNSSNAPKLPTDTIDALPQRQSSPRLHKVFADARANAERPIRFTRLPDGVMTTSLVENTPEEYVISLRPSMDLDLQENSIAHELMHIILQAKGLPQSFMSLMVPHPGCRCWVALSQAALMMRSLTGACQR